MSFSPDLTFVPSLSAKIAFSSPSLAVIHAGERPLVR